MAPSPFRRGRPWGCWGSTARGKSTLLKLLAGVTSPTSGSLQIQGRVGALLELGAGFQPEYTGIENARLSLTIAGFSRAEIDETLPSILSFADIGDFARAPVKVYSSGMFVRLAFACATAARPDILLVDEALSVGDLFFQAKCVSRMREMLARGTTLVFVSHDLGAVKSICSRCLLLNRAGWTAWGTPKRSPANTSPARWRPNNPSPSGPWPSPRARLPRSCPRTLPPGKGKRIPAVWRRPRPLPLRVPAGRVRQPD